MEENTRSVNPHSLHRIKEQTERERERERGGGEKNRLTASKPEKISQRNRQEKAEAEFEARY